MTTAVADIEIVYTIKRDGKEVGFGASCVEHTVDAALYGIQSDIANRLWETSPGMPDPHQIDADDAASQEENAHV